jgi:hypothetical protein
MPPRFNVGCGFSALVSAANIWLAFMCLNEASIHAEQS